MFIKETKNANPKDLKGTGPFVNTMGLFENLEKIKLKKRKLKRVIGNEAN